MEWISVKDVLPKYKEKEHGFRGLLGYVEDTDSIYGGYQQVVFYGHFSFVDLHGNYSDADEEGEVSSFGWHYERDSEGEFDSLIFDMNDKVTHWMPLPAPPKEEE